LVAWQVHRTQGMMNAIAGAFGELVRYESLDIART
jgi:hypothetical protein